ncbi:unnamed protein product [Caenorhabditis brenneri]
MLILSSFATIFIHITNIIFIDFTQTPSTSTSTSDDTTTIIPAIGCFPFAYSKMFLFATSIFGTVCVIWRFLLKKKPAENVLCYKKQLKYGVFGLLVMTIAQKVGWWYLSRKVPIGFALTFFSELSAMGFFLVFILAGACACDVKYRQWKEYLGFVVVFTVMITYATMSFMGTNIDLLVHAIYTISIAVYIIDIHVLSCNQIRVVVPSVPPENEMEKRQSAQDNQLFLGDSFMV